MRLVIKDWTYGVRLAYEDVEPELLAFDEPLGTRVLPSRYYDDKQSVFTLIKYYKPGEKKSAPDGLFEVRKNSGAIHNFGNDEIVLHPEVIRQRKIKVKWPHTEISDEDNVLPKRIYNTDVKVKGKRGRKPLSEEEKQKRIIIEQQKISLNPDRRRGRKPLSEEIRKIRDEKIKKINNNKGKRGRKPLSDEEKKQREILQQQKLSLNPERKRGRPSKKTT